MSIIDSELQDGLAEMEADQSTDGVPNLMTFPVGSYQWPVSLNTNKRGSAYEIGGKVILYDFAARVRLNAIDRSGAQTFSDIDPPQSGTTGRCLVTIDGTQYRVEFVDTAHGGFLTLLLTTDAK
jgi:hypothetical protein